MTKKNRYEGKLHFFIDGKSEEELGSEVFAQAVADGMTRAMFELYNDGKLGPEYDCLCGYRYIPPNERT